ncbi:PKD domain-containing protein [Mangrovibacterium marinum]|uniref:Outer membrane protein assembly factor BamB n=1 Tax=Mangrovibacterium marinum TaxID=1639118 RepID=A0A2T5BZ62_9BACT|nr:PKD domain-containing protein [Mangrovibacterium marinum]PTN07551.1 outer membrane protein assembly factor BamB [Mangrovibacterium marinum]
MKKINFLIISLSLLFAVSCSETTELYNTASSANFTVAEDYYELGQSVEFADFSVPSGDNSIVSWLWEFGDLAGSTSTEQNPSFAYSEGGSFTVKLTVTDNNGLKASATKDVVIIDPSKAIRVMWQKPLLGAIQNTVSPALSLDGNTVYMYADQSVSNAYDVALKAYDTENGNLKWAFNVNDALAALNTGGGVRIVYASPSVGSNGDIYIAVRDLRNSGAARKSYLFAIKSDGTLRWNYAFNIDANINYVTPAIDSEGRIYIGHLTNSPFQIAVLNPNDGTVESTISLPVGVRSGISLSQNGHIYFCSTGANGVYSYDLSGVEIFTYNSDLATTGGAISIDSEGNLYTVAALTGGGGIMSVSANGNENWVYQTSGVIQWGGVSLGADGTIYANGGKAVEDVVAAGIVALNPDGTLKWHYTTSEDVNNCVPLIDNRGYIHAITDDGTYFILKSDGTLFASEKLGVKSYASPVMDSSGNLYIGVETEAGVSEMFCIASGAKSFANSDWPMKGQNPQRTDLQK